jgi:hypothetical protein
VIDVRRPTTAGARSLSAGASLLVCLTGAFACESDANDCTVLATCEAASPSDGGTTNGEAGSGGAGGLGGASGQNAGAGGEAGSDESSGADSGAAGAGGGGERCDPASAPAEDVCVLDDAFGVFVSPDGDDEAGDGSRARPFKTLSAGIVASLERGRRVYACADGGAFDETLDLGALESGLELYGGLACEDFSYTGEKTVVTSTKRQALLEVKDLDGFRAEDFAFVAGNAEAFGASSVGALVANSSGVEFRRVRFEAGRGANGVNPTRPDVSFPPTSSLSGRAAAGESGGDERLCECPGGATSTGGAGGDAATLGQAGQDGLPDWGGGRGGPAEVCDLERTRGANAPMLLPAPGAATWGRLDASGWTPEAGASGASGEAGQGGGGGGAITIATNPPVLAGGGGGGCGGCGGVGGPGGGGGGASIALAVFESSVSIERSELVAADGGNGGEGRMGQLAQLTGGKGGSSAEGCAGGDGGLGASGAAGGGGAGGVSVGVLYEGERPALDLLTAVVLGNPGVPGKGGEKGSNDGVAGVARAVLAISPEATDP